jgi:hypothetical protein
MGNPANSFQLAGGGRAYRWTDPETGEDTDVLSVTTIRKLCGAPPNLVSWQLANVVNLAMGMRKKETPGPRGGKPTGYVRDGEFPGVFVEKMLATEGSDAELMRVRKWLYQQAEDPRDRAAARGTTVHNAIENRDLAEDIDLDYVQAAFTHKHCSSVVGPEDVAFAHDCMVQFADMRAKVPFVILSQEPQVWNLTAGYAGSFDVLLWFLGEFDEDGEFTPLPDANVEVWQGAADAGAVTLEDIREVGGKLVLGDWKTSGGVYTDHVTQVTAYLACEFVGENGVKDMRLTEILHAAMEGALVHIRPDGWAIHFVNFRSDVLLAFLGSCAFARFLAQHDTPAKLFELELKGKADDVE